MRACVCLLVCLFVTKLDFVRCQRNSDDYTKYEHAGDACDVRMCLFTHTANSVFLFDRLASLLILSVFNFSLMFL